MKFLVLVLSLVSLSIQAVSVSFKNDSHIPLDFKFTTKRAGLSASKEQSDTIVWPRAYSEIFQKIEPGKRLTINNPQPDEQVSFFDMDFTDYSFDAPIIMQSTQDCEVSVRQVRSMFTDPKTKSKKPGLQFMHNCTGQNAQGILP